MSTSRTDAEVDDAVLFGKQNDDSVSGQGEMNFLLTKTTICELIDAASEGIHLLHLSNNYKDSTTSVQKFKILLGRWVVKAGGGENDR